MDKWTTHRLSDMLFGVMIRKFFQSASNVVFLATVKDIPLLVIVARVADLSRVFRQRDVVDIRVVIALCVAMATVE